MPTYGSRILKLKSVKRLEFTVRNKTGDIIPNATIRIYNRTSVILPDFKLNQTFKSKYLELEEDKYHIKFKLPTGQILELKNLTANKNLTVDPQFVDSYTGTLPSSTTAKSYVVALNDTELTYDYAEITLPVTGTVNRILHCTSWNFTTATCSSWESHQLSEYNYTLNSTHLIFNATNFDAYLAGYYEAPTTPSQGSSGGGSSGGGGAAPQGVTSFSVAPEDIIIKISVNLKSSVVSPSLAVEKISTVPEPLKTAYQYFNITPKNFDNSKLENATIEFKVNKSWINKNNISEIYMARYENAWNKLRTELMEETQQYNKYKAYTGKFSYFAIAGEKQAQAGQQGPSQPQTACTPEWSCTAWSECKAGQQTRTCTDVNNCNTLSGKPEESKPCEVQPGKHDYTLYLALLAIAAILLAVAYKKGMFKAKLPKTSDKELEIQRSRLEKLKNKISQKDYKKIKDYLDKGYAYLAKAEMDDIEGEKIGKKK